MERARRKDCMDGGVATQRAHDVLTLVGDAMLAFTTREQIVAEALRIAYAEGYTEGLAAEDAENHRLEIMRRTCDDLRDYMRKHVVEGNAKARRDLLTRVENDIGAAFDLVVGKHTDVSREKRGEMLQAFVLKVQELVDSAEFDDVVPTMRRRY